MSKKVWADKIVFKKKLTIQESDVMVQIGDERYSIPGVTGCKLESKGEWEHNLILTISHFSVEADDE